MVNGRMPVAHISPLLGLGPSDLVLTTKQHHSLLPAASLLISKYTCIPSVLVQRMSTTLNFQQINLVVGKVSNPSK